MNKIKIATESQTLSFFRKTYGAPNRKKKIHAFYSSDFGKIITDEHLMLIPIDERMATRAHAVFDVLYSKHMNLINLESHINRLFNSAETVKINPPISK